MVNAPEVTVEDGADFLGVVGTDFAPGRYPEPEALPEALEVLDDDEAALFCEDGLEAALESRGGRFLEPALEVFPSLGERFTESPLLDDFPEEFFGILKVLLDIVNGTNARFRLQAWVYASFYVK